MFDNDIKNLPFPDVGVSEHLGQTPLNEWLPHFSCRNALEKIPKDPNRRHHTRPSTTQKEPN